MRGDLNVLIRLLTIIEESHYSTINSLSSTELDGSGLEECIETLIDHELIVHRVADDTNGYYTITRTGHSFLSYFASRRN